MGRNPYSLQGGESMYYSATKTFKMTYPPYKHKKLTTRKSLLASVNARKGAMKNITNSTALTEDEKIIVEEINKKLAELSNKIKENDENKNKKPVIRFEGTGSIFKGI